MERKELYEAIEQKLRSSVPEVKHIALWNHNVEYIEEEQAWERPAVFVEFGQIDWRIMTNNSYRGSGRIRLHVVTDWSGEAPFSLTDKITAAVDGLEGERFGGMSLVATYPNHNHEDLVESIEELVVKYLRLAE